MMRLSITVDPELLEEVRRLAQVRTKREAIERELRDLLDRPSTELLVGAALRDAEAELAGGSRRGGLPLCPVRRELDRSLELAPRSAGGKADVQAHRDVGAEAALDLGNPFGGEACG